MGSVAFSFRSENCVSPRWQVSELKSSFSRYFLRFPVSFWKEKKIANIVCEALGFKRKQKRRVFRLCYNNLILIPRQLFKITIVVHVNGLKSFKKIVKLKIKKLEWKKSFVWMFRIDLKKITSKKNYCDKNSLLIRAIQSHCGLLTRKRIKRPVTVALPYPPPLHQNEGKSTKKIEIESVFHVFSTTLQKDELFSFWWPYLMPARPPFRPPKPWEWM